VLLIVFLGALGWLVVRRRPPDGAALPS
jgi:hypothetical protein